MQHRVSNAFAIATCSKHLLHIRSWSNLSLDFHCSTLYYLRCDYLIVQSRLNQNCSEIPGRNQLFLVRFFDIACLFGLRILFPFIENPWLITLIATTYFSSFQACSWGKEYGELLEYWSTFESWDTIWIPRWVEFLASTLSFPEHPHPLPSHQHQPRGQQPGLTIHPGTLTCWIKAQGGIKAKGG